jgi:membrane protein
MANKISAIVQQVTKFIEKDIWNIDLSKTSQAKRLIYQLIKVLYVAFKGIKEDKVLLRASALTFFSLLSIVPVLAMAFGLAKGFGLDKELKTQILENFSGQQEVLSKSLEFAQTLLDNTKGGLVAGIGMLVLFYTVMKLLTNIEISFNDIWYVQKHRTLTRKLTDYLAIVLLGPVLMVVANSMTIFIAAQIELLTETVSLIGLFKSIIFPLLRLLPFVVVWMLFTLIYLIMPNTSVKFKSAFIAGILAGSAFQIWQWALIRFELNVSQFNAIYGSFAALPLFLIWLQTSWLIVLYGSEISYAVQNVNDHESRVNSQSFSQEFKKKVALASCLLIIQNFKTGKHPITLSDININLKVPKNLLLEVINALIQCGVLSEVKLDDLTVNAYQPAVDTDLLSVQYILGKYDNVGDAMDDDIPMLRSFSTILAGFDETVAKSKQNQLMKEM